MWPKSTKSASKRGALPAAVLMCLRIGSADQNAGPISELRNLRLSSAGVAELQFRRSRSKKESRSRYAAPPRFVSDNRVVTVPDRHERDTERGTVRVKSLFQFRSTSKKGNHGIVTLRGFRIPLQFQTPRALGIVALAFVTCARKCQISLERVRTCRERAHAGGRQCDRL